MALIEVSGVTKIFGRNPAAALAELRAGKSRDALLAESGHSVALDDVSLSVEAGSIFVVMGLSGSGKSTLIRHINRLIDPTAGKVVIDGVDLLALSIPDLVAFRRKRLSMVFQHFALLPHRTVLENVAYGLELQGVRRRQRKAAAMEWIAAVGLSDYEKQYPAQLSGGMQQRVGLARALCVDHDILLMDEAFSALDPLIRSQMQDLLMSLQARLRKTIVFITHDLDEALRLGDRIAILRDGRVVQTGTPVEILMQPADDYVRAFVKDVNRSRVLTVETVMQPPPLRLTDETLEQALAEMRRRGTDVGYVVADDGYRGIVTEEAVRTAIAAREPAQVSDLAVTVETVTPDAAIAAALPATLASSIPVPVVTAEGSLEGVLSPARVGEVLQPPPLEGVPEAEATPTPHTPSRA
ncbi:MAG: glycine betaine/L-proline ABC transporter ATP-binding protein [Bauldia sp.]|nr:glycine betaine/L-proline ABC transporter ATP-binding protein [Bauldia sp.]